MNYIYDIVLNFNKNYYNFFEWNKKDNIINIKKIPVYKISDKNYDLFKNHNLVVDSSFLELIKDKTYTYSKLKLEYVCLLSNGKEALGVLFNDKGNLIKKSSLLLDEESEVLDEISNSNLLNIKINKINRLKLNDTIRYKKEKIDFLLKYINKEENITKLKYLYYDYFEIEENNIDTIKLNLINEINNNWNNKLNKLYETVKILRKTTQ